MVLTVNRLYHFAQSSFPDINDSGRKNAAILTKNESMNRSCKEKNIDELTTSSVCGCIASVGNV